MGSSTSSRVQYISPDEVAQLVLARPNRDDYLIIDVRSSDFAGGNIPGALNLTTREFGSEQRLNSTIATHIAPRVPPLKLIILHCMRSQTRGPYAAHLLAQSPALPRGVQIRVMKGGFQGWWRQFKGRGDLFENLEGSGEEQGEWEEGVLAPEGSRREADDSRRLREQGR
ncbi:Rhodanese-like protein [Rhodotorula sp. JG-1b]|nr:Rhodanese-like protein [Rhodotorula sp. JG-1b]